MQFSEYFKLNAPQGDFEFFDINVFCDTKRFVDPYCIQRDKSPLGQRMVNSINTFMYELLSSIRMGQYNRSIRLCRNFGETKGTRLGYSLKRLDGRGAGDKLSKDFVNSLYASLAVSSGAVQYLEETILVCEGIGRDIISDITIGIIKEQLIRFTQYICGKYNITTRTVDECITYYCPITKKWRKSKFELPHVYDKLTNKESYIILIPERFVPIQPLYNPRYFYTNIAIPIFREQAIDEGRTYVFTDKSGVFRALSRDIQLDLDFGGQKPKMSNLINENPELLPKYRTEVASYKFDKFG